MVALGAPFGSQVGAKTDPQINQKSTCALSILNKYAFENRLGPILGGLGAFLGDLGAVLGQSWAVLGRSWLVLDRSWVGLGMFDRFLELPGGYEGH